MRADLVSANYRNMFCVIAQSIEGGSVSQSRCITVVSAGVPLAPFNVAFVQDGASVEELSCAVETLRACRQSFTVRFLDSPHPDLTRVMVARGLSRVGDQPAMVLTDVVQPHPPLAGLEVIRAMNSQELARHADVCGRGFGVPPAWTRQVLTPGLLEQDGAEFYLGLVAGEPVATSALFANGGVAGVYFVSTLESHRHRGLAREMTWHAVRRGRELGLRLTCLQASPMGRPVYDQMGFELAATYSSFMGQPSVETLAQP